MAQSDNHRPSELRSIADALRQEKPTLSAMRKDEIKLRVLSSQRVRRAPGGWRARLVLASLLVMAFATNAFGVVGGNSGIKPKDLATTASGSDNRNAANTVYRAQAPRMTGGGHAPTVTPTGDEVHHGFELRCSVSDHPQRLEVNWGKGEKFHLEVLTSASCLDNPAIEPDPPGANFDTYIGSGTGRLNKGEGTAEWCFVDAGEPGKDADRITITIRDANGDVVLFVNSAINTGNHQAHGQVTPTAPAGSC
jgi:hypothetical protein